MTRRMFWTLVVGLGVLTVRPAGAGAEADLRGGLGEWA